MQQPLLQQEKKKEIPTYIIPMFHLLDAINHVLGRIPALQGSELAEELKRLAFDKKGKNNAVSDVSHLLSSKKAFTNLLRYRCTDFLNPPDYEPTNLRPWYCNYILGFHGNQFVMRFGWLDAEDIKAIHTHLATVQSGRLGSAKKPLQVETGMGIKHLQLAGKDVKILFSGVIIVKDSIIVSPQSGTFYESMKTIAADAAPDDAIFKALNILNIMTTQYALHLLQEQNENVEGPCVMDRNVCEEAQSSHLQGTLPSCMTYQILYKKTLPHEMQARRIAYDTCILYVLKKDERQADANVCSKDVPGMVGLVVEDNEKKPCKKRKQPNVAEPVPVSTRPRRACRKD